MTESAGNEREKQRIRTKISKIQFPESCPVCMESAEDLVFVTVTERIGPDSYESRAWIKGEDKTSAALETVKGATTFAVPTCMQHGSRSVRTTRTRMIAVLGFFVFFYPILFYLLRINLAIIYSRPLMEPLMGVLVCSAAMLASILYGLFPRALERNLHFENVKRTKDLVEVIIKNEAYRRLFIQMNEINTTIANGESEN